MVQAASVIRKLRTFARPKKAGESVLLFKTGKGQYGEGDIFIGVPTLYKRKIAKALKDLELTQVRKMLASEIHDYRQTGLFILVYQFAAADWSEQEKIYTFYLKNKHHVNSWDLVDCSAPHIVGRFLLNQKDRSVLYRLAKSNSLWDRRIAMVATQTLIKHRQFDDTLKLVILLLDDRQDLIHKACGWMLREIDWQSRPRLEKFLKQYHKRMPRTMLRYAIERFPQAKRQRYLKKKIPVDK